MSDFCVCEHSNSDEFVYFISVFWNTFGGCWYCQLFIYG